ncbi:MFS gliotoxin efflux transporter glia [Astrocystis sublimbata]|nr:MFS gliotoxin efflux transporter glia [Astrocystis sublimbata]
MSSTSLSQKPPQAASRPDVVPNTASQKGQDGGFSALRRTAVVAALLLSIFLVALDLTIVATAIPRITDEFHSIDDIGWYAAGFFITLGVFQSTWGKIYKHQDLKRTFLATIFFFELGSLVCAVSPNSIALIFGRAIAGVGGAGITGGVYIIIAYTVPAAQLATYIGSIGAVFSVASVAGPLLGGVFTQQLTWRWCFYLNLPVGGFAWLLILFCFRTPTTARPVPISIRHLLITLDIPGNLLCLGLLVSLTLALQWGGTVYPWSSPRIIGLLVTFGVASIIFGVHQWHAGENSMLVTRLLKQRTNAALSAYIFFLNAANFTLVYNLPQYFQVIKSLNATFRGIMNLPLIIPSAVFASASGYVLGRVGLYTIFLVVAATAITIGAGLIYTLDGDSTLGEIVGFQLLVGFGIGSGIQVPVTAAQAFSAPEDIPILTTAILFFQLVSGAIWVSVSQAILNNSLITSLAASAPDLSPQLVFQVGATEIRSTFHGADLDHILQAHLTGLENSWILSIVLGGVMLLSAFFTEWKSIKGSAPVPL